MALDRQTLREQIHALYRAEHERLGERGVLDLLDRARRWDLAPVLRSGGVVVFPHISPQDCGLHTAAAVNACLDSGAGRVIVISVLHAFTDEMNDARARVSAGEDPSRFPFWGVQGPGLPGRQEWRDDHSLVSFRHVWTVELTRRGVPGPEMVERYPYLAGGRPERLPGIDDVARLAEGAVMVSTIDPFHHGIGYGDAPGQALAPEAGGLELARRTVEEGIGLLARGDYLGYEQHCVRAKSDGRDAGQVFRYLRGVTRGRILDLAYSDTADLYGQPRPTWVAGALVAWE
jgi:hypothetical protein